MGTSELPGWGLSGRSVMAEPTGDKRELATVNVHLLE